MSRLQALFGVALATGLGVMTAITTFQPEFVEQADKRAGKFKAEHDPEGEQQKKADVAGDVVNAAAANSNREKDTQLSRAILQDLEEAKRTALGEYRGNGGFAWGIRRALFGGGEKEKEKGAGDGTGKEEAGK